MARFLERSYGGVVRYFSFFILLFLAWVSVISTSAVTLSEYIYFTEISGLPYLIILLVLIALSVIPPVNRFIEGIDRRLSSDRKLFRILYYSLILLLLTLSVIWVVITDFRSWADSLKVQDAAMGLISGDYSEYLPQGYIGYYPHHTGLALLESLIIKIFGVNSAIVFQLINAVCVPLIASALTGFTDSNLRKLIIIGFCILWIPLIFSTSHIYGNVPGLASALWGYSLLFDSVEKCSKKPGIASALFIAFACLVKENYLIFLIAYCLLCVLMFIEKKRSHSLVIALIAVMAFVLFSAVVNHITEGIIDSELADGVSKWSYIAMGMEEGYRAPGWCNDFNMESYRASGYDTELQSIMAKAEIRARIRELVSHPAYTLDFYVKKLASQWNEPTFQTVWNLRGHDHELPSFVNYIVSIYGSFRMIPYFKFFETVIYVAAFFFVCFEHRPDAKSLLLLTTFIGGVLFHLLWEAKAQYALFYFVLLIPVAMNGCGALRRCLNGLAVSKKAGEEDNGSRKDGVSFKGVIVCVLLFVLFLGVLYYLRIPTGLTGGSLPYYEYIVRNSI